MGKTGTESRLREAQAVKHGNSRKLAAQAAATKELLTASREEYQKKIEDADKNANNKLRIFEVGEN